MLPGDSHLCEVTISGVETRDHGDWTCVVSDTKSLDTVKRVVTLGVVTTGETIIYDQQNHQLIFLLIQVRSVSVLTRILRYSWARVTLLSSAAGWTMFGHLRPSPGQWRQEVSQCGECWTPVEKCGWRHMMMITS